MGLEKMVVCVKIIKDSVAVAVNPGRAHRMEVKKKVIRLRKK